MANFILDKRTYTSDQIKNGEWKESDLYFHQAFTFCQSWLNGQDTFEVATSGSTGKPKNIHIKRTQMQASAAATKAYFGIDHDSRILCCLNTWMIAGKMMLVRAMEWDVDVFLVKASANPLEETDLPGKLDFVAMVPLQVQSIFNNPSSLAKLKQIKTLIIGGAPSNPDLINSLKKHQINAYQTFGMTETVSHVALASLIQDELVYDALPGVTIGADTGGKLWIQGPMSDNQKIQTNDIVDILNGSQFKWLGRADFVINSGGVKVFPEIIEEKIQGTIFEHFGSIPYFIYGLPDERLNQKVVLVLEKTPPENYSFDVLIESLKRHVNRFHLPKDIFFLEKFEFTDSGKINRIATAELISGTER